MRSKNQLDNISVYMSKLLRHQPELGGIKIDDQGYTDVKGLLLALGITKEELDKIVETDNKGRYSYNKQGDMIRANQGHSLPYVHINYDTFLPTSSLYHGTERGVLDKIFSDGLLSQSRNYVHLSRDVETARKVGMRHAKSEENLVILEVDALSMSRDGLTFYISANGVVLIDRVDPKYLSIYKN
jgi:putative RNA 2'-phosphotransferase